MRGLYVNIAYNKLVQTNPHTCWRPLCLALLSQIILFLNEAIYMDLSRCRDGKYEVLGAYGSLWTYVGRWVGRQAGSLGM